MPNSCPTTRILHLPPIAQHPHSLQLAVRGCATRLCAGISSHILWCSTKPRTHVHTHHTHITYTRPPLTFLVHTNRVFVYDNNIWATQLPPHPTHTHSPYWKRVGSYHIRRSLRGSCSQIRKDWGKVQICVVILCVWVYVGVWVCKS